MTALDDYFDLWAEDSKIDRTELGEESIKIPQLHHKYYKMYSLERLNLVKLQEEMKILILASLVIIIVLLAFIALMIYALGDRLSQK